MKLATRLALVVVALAIAALCWWRGESMPRSAAAKPAIEAQAVEAATVSEPSAPASQLDSPAVQEPPAREAAADTEAVALAARFATPQGAAQLRLRVVTRGRGEPLAGERTFAHESGAEAWGAENVERSFAYRGEAPLTDWNGFAVFEIEPGKPYQAGVMRRKTEPLLAEIPPLAAGEVREVVLTVAVGPDLTLCGRVIDADSGAAIGGGTVQARSRFGEKVSDAAVRADGTFELQVLSTEQLLATVSADAYAPATIEIGPGHETLDTALEVRLSRPATLDVFVRRNGAAIENADVSVASTGSRVQISRTSTVHLPLRAEPGAWSGTTDANGRVQLANLPSGVLLSVSVRVGRQPPRNEATTLAPGEHRSMEIVFGSGASIVGRVEDGDGRPLRGTTIWCTTTGTLKPRVLEHYDEPAAARVTDDQGRFQIDDLFPGTWLVGLAPRDAAEVAALAQVVEIDGKSPTVEIVLRVDRGLYLKGVVLDADEKPVPVVDVHAFMDGGTGQQVGVTDANGRFALGPAPAGRYRILAGAVRAEYASSEPVVAKAGDTDIVLRVSAAASIRGRAIAPDDQPRKYDCTLSPADQPFGVRPSNGSSAAWKFDRLAPGTYSIAISSADGLCGVRTGLQVRAGQQLDDVEVVLAPAAKLRLHNATEARAEAVILSGDVTIAIVSMAPDAARNQTVPTGALEVRWQSGGDIVRVEHVTLAAREERELAWDGTP